MPAIHWRWACTLVVPGPVELMAYYWCDLDWCQSVDVKKIWDESCEVYKEKHYIMIKFKLIADISFKN